MDAKDILGLPKTQFQIPQEKKSRPPKEPQRKPDGISREVMSSLLLAPFSSLCTPHLLMWQFFTLVLLRLFSFMFLFCLWWLQVYALTGGVAPLMPSIDVSQLKKRPPSDEKVRRHLLCYAALHVSSTLTSLYGIGVCFLADQVAKYKGPLKRYNSNLVLLEFFFEVYWLNLWCDGSLFCNHGCSVS